MRNNAGEVQQVQQPQVQRMLFQCPPGYCFSALLGMPKPSMISHRMRFPDPKPQKCKEWLNLNPYNLSNNPDKIKNLKLFRVLQNPRGMPKVINRLRCLTPPCL